MPSQSSRPILQNAHCQFERRVAVLSGTWRVPFEFWRHKSDRLKYSTIGESRDDIHHAQIELDNALCPTSGLSDFSLYLHHDDHRFDRQRSG